MRMPRAHGCAALGAALLALTPAVGWANTPATEQIAQLNALRSAHGFPAGLVENPEWSRGCADLAAALGTDRPLVHLLDPATVGYTPGADFAARSSVLARGSGWGVANPWLTAPFHLMQLLSPQLSELGAADLGGVQCMTTWPGFTRRSTVNALFAFPGPGSVVDAGVVATESPSSPSDLLGLGPEALTGPNLIVLADGPWVDPQRGELNYVNTVTDAQLVGPDGPVEVRVIPSSDPTVGPVMPEGAIIVPVRPLRAGQVYSARVELENAEGARVASTWSFGTQSIPNRVTLVETSWRQHAGELTVDVAATSEAGDPVLQLRSGSDVREVAFTRSGGFWEVDGVVVPAGPWTACATSGGDPGPFATSSTCMDIGPD